MWGYPVFPQIISQIFDDNEDLLDANVSISEFSTPVVSNVPPPIVSKLPIPKARKRITQKQKQSPSTPSMMIKAAKRYLRTRFKFFTEAKNPVHLLRIYSGMLGRTGRCCRPLCAGCENWNKAKQPSKSIKSQWCEARAEAMVGVFLDMMASR